AAEYAREKRGATVTVEFKPGAGATIATGQVARAKPDGYTLSLFASSPFFGAPHLQKVPYDVNKDFTYITTYVAISNAVYVKSDSPHKTIKDIMAYAKANPGKLRWGTATTRSTAEISTNAALRHEGVTATLVPFGGGSEAITALLGGHIDMAVSSDYGPQLDAGNVRLVAETGSAKVPNMPQVPTYKELGYPVSVTTTYGLFGPAGLPPDVIAWWDSLIKEMMETPAYHAAVKKMRFTPYYENSATFTRSVADGYQRFGKAVDDLGLRPK
ncbi:MAG TPA: tripartite tricarboxylate transporter substrate binding protein, partial [Ramlibacter sp.]|nr:tripartite tricarboxylate transporter substrate binding protein [Ramlibacter sp.]